MHGAGKKLGVTRDLTPEERGTIALSGYLRHLEDAFAVSPFSDRKWLGRHWVKRAALQGTKNLVRSEACVRR